MNKINKNLIFWIGTYFYLINELCIFVNNFQIEFWNIDIEFETLNKWRKAKPERGRKAFFWLPFTGFKFFDEYSKLKYFFLQKGLNF